jgi:hypothetical protein
MPVRRNGKRPSCEPCRISKLSCDHVTPICGRCQRRKIPQKCIWHPAPMTGLRPRVRKQRDSAELDPRPHIIDAHANVETDIKITRSASPLAASPRTDIHPTPSWNLESSSRDSLAPAQQHRPLTEPEPGNSWRRGLDPVASTRSAITPRSDPANDWTPSPGLARSSQNPYSGFLGSTSYSAVFDEHHNKIGIASAHDQNGLSEPQIEGLSSREHERKIKEGATVLAQLADFKHLKALVTRWLEYAKGLSLVSSSSHAPFLDVTLTLVILPLTLTFTHSYARLTFDRWDRLPHAVSNP